MFYGGQKYLFAAALTYEKSKCLINAAFEPRRRGDRERHRDFMAEANADKQQLSCAMTIWDLISASTIISVIPCVPGASVVLYL